VLLALALILLALDAMGVLRPLPAADELRWRVEERWAGISSYEAHVIQSGQVVAGAPGRGVVRWDRGGRFGISAPDISGFFHRQVVSGDLREFYQPGAEVLARMEVRGLGAAPYGSWKITGYPGLQDLVRLLLEAREVTVIGRSRLGGESCVAARVEPSPPPALEKATGVEREFYQARFAVPWTVHVGERSRLPLFGSVPGIGGSQGWAVEFAQVRLDPPLRQTDWILPSAAPVRVLELRCDLARPATVRAADERVQRVVNRWKGMVMAATRGRTPLGPPDAAAPEAAARR